MLRQKAQEMSACESYMDRQHQNNSIPVLGGFRAPASLVAVVYVTFDKTARKPAAQPLELAARWMGDVRSPGAAGQILRVRRGT